jgi:hypothetical protein
MAFCIGGRGVAEEGKIKDLLMHTVHDVSAQPKRHQKATIWIRPTVQRRLFTHQTPHLPLTGTFSTK